MTAKMTMAEVRAAIVSGRLADSDIPRPLFDEVAGSILAELAEKFAALQVEKKRLPRHKRRALERAKLLEGTPGTRMNTPMSIVIRRHNKLMRVLNDGD